MTKKRLKSKKPEAIKKLPPTLAVNALMHGGGFSFFPGSAKIRDHVECREQCVFIGEMRTIPLPVAARFP